MTMLGSAAGGEHGGGYGNQPGNQYKLSKDPANSGFKDELVLGGWWNGDAAAKPKPLQLVYRFKNEEYRKKASEAMVAACNNANIGYANDNRGTLRTELLKMPGGITVENLGKLKVRCDTDCSALGSICIKAACGLDLGLPSTADFSPDDSNTIPLLDKYLNLFDKVRINEQTK